MFSLGETLKRARLEQGLDLYTVAAQTKISAKYLEAIESDNRQALPSGFFYRSFVEQYARFLSLDSQQIEAEINRVLSADGPLPLPGFESVVSRNVPPLTPHRFHTRRSYTSLATLVLVLAGCSGFYAWWHGARSSFSLKAIIGSARELVTPKMAAVSQKVDRPAPSPVAISAPPPTAPAPDPIASEVVSSSANPDYKVMLDLLAREATWLSVSSDGKPVFSGILQANQSKSVGGKQFAKMRVGNAAGIDVRLNGRMLGPLGARGQVLVVLFTPDNFQIFSPPKESD